MMPFGHKDSVGTFPNHLAFPYDIVDKRSEYVITADIPGASKDMVEVSVDDDRVLHIVDERADRHEERGGSEADGTFIFIYVWAIRVMTSCFVHRGQVRGLQPIVRSVRAELSVAGRRRGRRDRVDDEERCADRARAEEEGDDPAGEEEERATHLHQGVMYDRVVT